MKFFSKYIKYFLFAFLFLFMYKANVYADDAKISLITTEDVLQQYNTYTLKITGKVGNNYALTGDCEVSYGSTDTTITFDENGVAYLDVTLTDNSTDILLKDKGSNYYYFFVEFDSTKQSTIMTGQRPDEASGKLLGGYVLPGNQPIVWHIEKTNKTTNINFKKYWEDEGNESYRPDSSTFYLYNKDNLDTPVATTTITYDDDTKYEYDGVFNNVPYYDSNGNLIEYTIKESNIPNYVNSTDSKYGLRIKFNEQMDMDRPYILRMYYEDNDTGEIFLYNKEDDGVGTNTDKMINDSLDVVYPYTYFASSATTIGSLKSSYEKYSYVRSIEELIGNNYPETHHPFPLGESHLWHYQTSVAGHSQNLFFAMRTESWGGKFGLLIDEIKTIGNDTELTSTLNLKSLDVEKRWEDEGYESYRPQSVTFDIYDSDDMNTVVRTVTLNSSNATSDNTWKLTVNNLPIYNSNGEEIEYAVVERPVDNYLIVYDYPEGYNKMAIVFSDNTFIESSLCFSGSSTFNAVGCAVSTGTGFGQSLSMQLSYGAGPLTGQTHIIPTKNLKFNFRVTNTQLSNDSDFEVKIEDIYLVKNTLNMSATTSENYGSGTPLKNGTYNNYLNMQKSDLFESDFTWKYVWNGTLTPKANATVVRNLINLKDVEFTKKWEDEGYESYRPESITFKIYNDRSDDVVKEITLTSANVDSNDNNIWNGVFKDVPKYYEDGTEIKYTIKEEPVENYSTTYDLSDIKGFLITFDDNTYVANSSNISIPSENRWASYYTRDLSTDYSFRKDKLKGATIYVKATDSNKSQFMFYFSNTNAAEDVSLYGFKIKSIVPVNYDNEFEVISSNPSFVETYFGYEGDNFPESTHPFSDYKYYKYTYKPLSNSFEGADIIINTINLKKLAINKKWEDEGFESYRPDEITFDIYNSDDMNTIVRTVTLSEDDKIDDYNWKKEIDGFPAKNSNNKEIEYVIKERNVDNYKTNYLISDEYNGVLVKFTSDSTVGTVSMSSGLYIYYFDTNNNYRSTGSIISLSDKEVIVPSLDFYLSYYKKHSSFNDVIKIESITPIKLENYVDTNFGAYNNVNSTEWNEATDNDYLVIENMDNYYWHYTSPKEFNNASKYSNKIKNSTNLINVEFTKLWDDEGYEDKRPDEVTFKLYDKNDLDTVVRELTLTGDNVDENNSNKWNGVFNAVPKYDNDGNEIEYIVKEDTIDGYKSTQEDNEITNEILLYSVKILKTDSKNNPLKGAKLKIVDKDNVELYSFTSTTTDKTVTLPVGEYTLIEEEAPNGYSKAKDIKFTVDNDGKVIINENEVEKVVMIDYKQEVKNVETLDNISKYLLMFIVSIVSIISFIIVRKKMSKI